MTVSFVSTTPDTYNPGTSDIDITVPAGVVDGDWLLVITGTVNASETPYPPSGWVWQWTDNAFASAGICWSPILSTSDAGTTVTLTGAAVSVAHVYHMRGGDPMLKPPHYTFERSFSSATSTPDAPAVTPDYGSEEYISLVVVWHSSTGSASAAPTGYTDLTNTGNATGNDIRLATAAKATGETAATIDPGTWTLTASRNYGAYTIAIPTADPEYTYLTDVVWSADYNSATNTIAVALPSGLSNKGCVIGVKGADAVAAISTPSGWTQLVQGETPTLDGQFALFYRDCDGTEGGSVTVTLGGNDQALAFAMALTGVSFADLAPAGATFGEASTATPNPPSLASSETGAAFVITGATRHPQQNMDAQGGGWSGYGAHMANRTDGTGDSVNISVGWKETDAFSSPENPGTLTMLEAAESVSFTAAFFAYTAPSGNRIGGVGAIRRRPRGDRGRGNAGGGGRGGGGGTPVNTGPPANRPGPNPNPGTPPDRGNPNPGPPSSPPGGGPPPTPTPTPAPPPVLPPETRRDIIDHDEWLDEHEL